MPSALSLPPATTNVYLLLPVSRRTYLGRAAIVVWVILMHLLALKMVDSIDRKNVTPRMPAAKSIQVVFVQPLSLISPPKTAVPAPEARHLQTSAPKPLTKSNLPRSTPKPLTTKRAVSPIQRTQRKGIEQIEPLANSHQVHQAETKAAPSPESAGSNDKSSNEQAAPLNLRVPKVSTNTTMDQQRIFRESSTKKSTSQVFSDNVERAQRPDCRSDYAGAGLLAAPKLLTDSISGKGCKW